MFCVAFVFIYFQKFSAWVALTRWILFSCGQHTESDAILATQLYVWFHPKYDQNEETIEWQTAKIKLYLQTAHTAHCAVHRYRFLWMKTETQPNKVITMAADRNNFVCLRIRGYQPHTHTHVSNVCQKCMLLVEFLSFPRTNTNDIISAAITAWNCH